MIIWPWQPPWLIFGSKGFCSSHGSFRAEALEILRVEPVDILLTDVKMPGMNGLELYQATRKALPQALHYFHDGLFCR